MNLESVSQAIEKGGSIRAAAKLLGKSYTALQWWIARNGYEVEYKAVLVTRFALTEKGKAAIAEGEK